MFNYHENVKIQSDVLKLIRENVKEHEETIDQNEPRDFTDKVTLFCQLSKLNFPSSCFLLIAIEELEVL